MAQRFSKFPEKSDSAPLGGGAAKSRRLEYCKFDVRTVVIYASAFVSRDFLLPDDDNGCSILLHGRVMR